MHHIITDGWSIGVLIDELSAALLRAAARRNAVPLPALPVQYADFAAWQREQLVGGPGLAEHMDYWREQLAGLDAAGAAHRPAPARGPRPSPGRLPVRPARRGAPAG